MDLCNGGGWRVSGWREVAVRSKVAVVGDCRVVVVGCDTVADLCVCVAILWVSGIMSTRRPSPPFPAVGHGSDVSEIAKQD